MIFYFTGLKFMKRMIKFGVVIFVLALLSGCEDSGGVSEISEPGSSIQQSETISPESDEVVSGEANAGGEPDSGMEPAADGKASIVYFTSDISSEGMVAVYEALGWEPAGKVAVKLSTGEPPASNYLRPELIGNLVELVDGTIVECNTAYGGSRAETAMHYQVAEAGKSVSDYLGNGERIVYISVLNNISIDCDCDGNPAEPDIHDIGVLASFDPVAIDQAGIDLAFAAEGSESLQNRVNGRDGLHTLEHAEEIGLGSRTYELVDIDD